MASSETGVFDPNIILDRSYAIRKGDKSFEIKDPVCQGVAQNVSERLLSIESGESDILSPEGIAYEDDKKEVASPKVREEQPSGPVEAAAGVPPGGVEPSSVSSTAASGDKSGGSQRTNFPEDIFDDPKKLADIVKQSIKELGPLVADFTITRKAGETRVKGQAGFAEHEGPVDVSSTGAHTELSDSELDKVVNVVVTGSPRIHHQQEDEISSTQASGTQTAGNITINNSATIRHKEYAFTHIEGFKVILQVNPQLVVVLSVPVSST